MRRSFLIWLKELLARRSKKPWACFESPGPDAAGRLEFSVSWNPAFTRNLQKLGMAGQTDEETVQLFFLQLRMLPESLVEKDEVNPEATPNLTSEANSLRR